MLPTPPIDAITGDHIAAAFTALVGLDTRIQNQHPTRRESLTTALASQEAAHSAALDHITTTPRSLATSLATGGHDLAASNPQSLLGALDTGRTARRLATANRTTAATDALTAVHRDLTRTTHAAHAGRLRAHTSTTSDTDPGQISTDLATVAEYAQHTWANPIATAALVYAEINLIEPYATGTPRAARAWITHLMTAWNITDTIATPLSSGLTTTALAAAIDRYRDHNPHPIIALFATAIFTSCVRAATFVDALTAESAAMHQALDTLGTRTDSHAWPMTDHLLGHPVTTSSAAGAAVGTDRYGGWTAATKLADAGLLAQTTKDNTNTWEASRALTIWATHFPNYAATISRAAS